MRSLSRSVAGDASTNAKPVGGCLEALSIE
jgi:hypothetical protein